MDGRAPLSLRGAGEELLVCHHHDAARCRSCSLIELPRPDQLTRQEEHCRGLLSPFGPDLAWWPTVTGPGAGFRNKAKMVVAGTADHPTLGILGPDLDGVDLRDCALHSSGLRTSLPVLAEFITRAGLSPYSVRRRTGELKHLLVTESPDGELMVRFVMRSTESLARVRKHLGWLDDRLPQARVVSVNVQPDHKAVLEGDREIVLSRETALPMRLETGVTLQLRPQSFFQTNTEVAGALYRLATEWSSAVDARTVLDLYCGVGGFALHLAGPGRQVTGVEQSTEAVESARLAAARLGVAATFHAGDAEEFALGLVTAPDLVVVNPPRRGIGDRLTGWLEEAPVPTVLYSSCNTESLVRDLAAMPALRPVRACVLDMFPQTDHYEVLVLLERRGA